MTFLTQELCTKTGTNQLLFPPPWLQPNPMQKFHPAPFLVALGREHSSNTEARREKQLSLSSQWIFLTIPAVSMQVRGKSPASLMGCRTQPGWGPSLPAPEGSQGPPAPFSSLGSASPPRRGLCLRCYLWESKNIQSNCLKLGTQMHI